MNHLENPGRVLLVDDNAQLLAGLSRNLRRLVPVVTANSGDEALTLLKKDRDFSIIISDMRMPGMDGAEFFSEAKLLAPDAVRILLTGQADLTAVVNAINYGRIYRFIAKPVDFEELRNIVSAAMAHFRLQQEERRQREAIERSVIDRAEDLLALSSVPAWGRAARVRRAKAAAPGNPTCPDGSTSHRPRPQTAATGTFHADRPDQCALRQGGRGRFPAASAAVCPSATAAPGRHARARRCRGG